MRLCCVSGCSDQCAVRKSADQCSGPCGRCSKPCQQQEAAGDGDDKQRRLAVRRRAHRSGKPVAGSRRDLHQAWQRSPRAGGAIRAEARPAPADAPPESL